MATDQSTDTEDTDERSSRLTTVFWITIGLTVAFVAFGVFLTDPFGKALRQASSFVIDSLGWAFLLLTMGFLVFALYLAFSRYGKSGWAGRTRSRSSDSSLGSACSSRPGWASA